MPHTWGGSEAEPVAAVPPCLLPPFAAGVVLAVFVDAATTVAFSVLGGPAIFSKKDFFHKSYRDCWANIAILNEILNVAIGDMPLSLCGSIQFDDTVWYGKKTKRSLRVCCLRRVVSMCCLLWLGRREVMESFLFNEEDLRPIMDGFPELQSAITSASIWMGGGHWIYYISNYSRSSKGRVSATIRIRHVPQGYLPFAFIRSV